MLRWVVSSLADIDGFRVYRATSPDGPFDLLTERALPASSPGVFEDDTVWPETTFWYQLRAVLTDGSEDIVGHYLPVVEVGGTLSLAMQTPVPNPFHAGCAFSIDVPDHAGSVRLAVYNVRGQLVTTLIDGPMERGRHPVTWDGTGSSGRRLAAGAYFVRLDVGGAHATRKVLLIRS